MKFELNEKELENLKAFKDEMLLRYRKEGTYDFKFSPTGVGTVIYVTRRESGDHKDLTDYDSW